MATIQIITKKDGSELKGFWNGKVYNTTVYFNVSSTGLKKDINWKKSIQIERSEISNIKSIDDGSDTFKKVDLSKPCPKCGTYCYGDCQS